MFKFKNSDLDNVFEPYRSGSKIANTNLILNGVDIANRYQAYNGQTKAEETGYKISGVDLSDLLAKKGTEVLGRLYKSYITPGNYLFEPLEGVEKYFVVIVGGGGGGGGGGGNNGDDKDGGAGGGGGGAGEILFDYYTIMSPINVTIGVGGYGGAGGTNYNASSGGNGGNTIFGPTIAYGGKAGGGGRRSDENQVFGISGYSISYGNGGRGGDGGSNYDPLSNPGQPNYQRNLNSIILSEGEMILWNNSFVQLGGLAGNLSYVGTYQSIAVAPGGGGGAGENGYLNGGAGGRGRDGMSPEGGGGGSTGYPGNIGAGGGGGGAAGGHHDKRNGMNGGPGGNGAVFIYY